MEAKQDKLFNTYRIKFVNSGTANSFIYLGYGQKHKVIEINKLLIDEPQLFKTILAHELRHNYTTYSLHDLKIDLTNKDKIPTFQLLKFTLFHPSAWKQFLPFYYTKKDWWIFDISLIIIYILAIIIYIGIRIFL